MSQRKVSSNRNEDFYNEVRKRTAESWRKQYVSTPEEEEEAKKILEKLRTKPESIYTISNVIWLLVSIGVFYVTDFAGVLLYHPGVDRWWLAGGTASLGVAGLCFLYCVVWLSCIRKVNSDHWEDHNPFVIPVATVAMLAGCGLTCKAVWPVWNVLTFPIVSVQIYGFIIFVSMIPGSIF